MLGILDCSKLLAWGELLWPMWVETPSVRDWGTVLIWSVPHSARLSLWNMGRQYSTEVNPLVEHAGSNPALLFPHINLCKLLLLSEPQSTPPQS